QIVVGRGWVYLEGEVDGHDQKTAAEDAVQSLVGVRGVTSKIIVKPQAVATEVKSLVKAAFPHGAGLNGQQVRVESDDGKLALHGSLRGCAEGHELEQRT